MGLLKKLSATLTGSDRYESKATNSDEFNKALALRAKVFKDLLAQWHGDTSECPAVENPVDGESTHILCSDSRTGEAVGYLRLTPGHRLKASPDATLSGALAQFPASVHPFLSVWGLTVVEGPDRAAIRRSLFMAAYTHALTQSKAALVTTLCPPTEFPEYRVFGFRPLSRVTASRLSGYLLPLFLDLYGYQSLKLLDSPLYEAAEAAGLPPGTIGSDWYRDFVFQNGSIDTGYMNYKSAGDSEFHSVLTANLKDSARKQLLTNALHMTFRFGETVLPESAHDRSLGVVKKGALEVYAGKELLAVLGEGDAFGELAFILGGGRKAQVKAASEDTEILVLNQSVVNTIKNPADQLQFWKNLAALLANRVVSANTALNDARKPRAESSSATPSYVPSQTGSQK